MKKPVKNNTESKELRRVAEERLLESPPDDSELRPENFPAILQEFRIHQIELEIQNEELRRTRAELEESRNLYFDLYDLAPVGYLSLDEHGIIRRVNLTAVSLLGVGRSFLLGSSLVRYVIKDHQGMFSRHRQAVLRQDDRQAIELKLLGKDEREQWVQLQSSAELDADGKPLGVRIIMTDISSRKRLEERQALTATVMKYLNAANDLEALVRDILLAIKKETGLEALGIRLNDGEDYPYYVTNGFFDDFVETERYLCARDASGNLIRDAQGNARLECMCGNVIRGRTDPKYPFFTAGGSFWSNCTTDLLASTTDADRQARTRNRCNKEGYESVALIPLRSKGSVIGLLQMNDHRKNRFTLNMIEFFEELGLSIGIAVDRWMAEKEKIRRGFQLGQAQKMEAIGTLAGGIAHDFNNILAAMMGYTEIALSDLRDSSPTADSLRQVLTSGNRAAELVRRILSFSRQGESAESPLELAPLIEETLKMLRASLPATIEIQTDLQETEYQILADPGHINQVVMNLCTNAAQAMEEAGGVMAIRLSTVELDEDAAETFTRLNTGKYHKLTVSDTGIGMTPEVVAKMFEPFFTTKPPGKGTGMGLAGVHGIVREHHGEITVNSKPGKGTTICVYLPVVEAAPVADKAEKNTPVVGGSERILLVDDERALAEIGSQVLERLGYAVTVFTSSREALERFKTGPNDFDLVITDYTMPELTGAKLSQEILATRPGMPIIICTGFSQQLDVEKAKELGARKLLMKPLSRITIARAVRETLDQTA